METGRWAKQKGRLRVFGHENGTKSVREIGSRTLCRTKYREFNSICVFNRKLEHALKLEVQTLMRLLISSLKNEIKTLQDNDIRLQCDWKHRKNYQGKFKDELQWMSYHNHQKATRK